MKILFICKYNRFRSKVAESVFNKLNKNRKNTVKSAGIIIGRPINSNTFKISKNIGYILRGKPSGLTSNLLIWQEMIIIVADNVPASLFKDNYKYGKKLLVWKISDANSNNKKEVEDRIHKIELRVKKLVSELK